MAAKSQTVLSDREPPLGARPSMSLPLWAKDNPPSGQDAVQRPPCQFARAVHALSNDASRPHGQVGETGGVCILRLCSGSGAPSPHPPRLQAASTTGFGLAP
jgi:hypothetical protein